MVPVVIALLAIGGVVAAQQGVFSGDSTATTTPSVMATAQTADPSDAPTPADDPTDSATPSSSASPSASETSSAATRTLDDCRDSVQAADRTITAAKTGIGHWSEHVQAQTDANAGTISVDKMDAIFKRTRLAGPDDTASYAKAVKAMDRAKASCEAPAGAPASVRKQLSTCAERADQQRPVLAAAKDGMDDWESHLAAMMRSRMGHVHDAQGVWIRAWRAAPPHISAFDRAVEDFDAPSC